MDQSLRKVSAPGKIILAGEHAVVYNYPCLVAAIDRRLTVTAQRKNIGPTIIKAQTEKLSLVKFALNRILKAGEAVILTIDSDLPLGGGLGSSAALATALTYALLPDRSVKFKARVIKRIENFQHGKASGVDQTIVREGGMMIFSKKGGFKSVKLSLPSMLLIDSGTPKETTGEMVKKVARGNWETQFKRMGQLVKSWRPEVIKENEKLLEEIGVVGKKAQKMISAIEAVGGTAKVCGAGGVKAGSGIILAYHPQILRLKNLVREKHWSFFQAKLGAEGVCYES